jgi:hypothetical protein
MARLGKISILKEMERCKMMGKYHDTFTSQGQQKAMEIVSAINLLGGKARIGVTYRDYGQDWTWETILVHHKGLDMEYQALSPRDFREMNEGTISPESIKKIVADATK